MYLHVVCPNLRNLLVRICGIQLFSFEGCLVFCTTHSRDRKSCNRNIVHFYTTACTSTRTRTDLASWTLLGDVLTDTRVFSHGNFF